MDEIKRPRAVIRSVNSATIVLLQKRASTPATLFRLVPYTTTLPSTTQRPLFGSNPASATPPLMPHPIIETDKVVRLVIDELVEISPETIVSFALTCRSLEEPALSALWEQQTLLSDLVGVLPNYTVGDEHGAEVIVSGRGFPADRVSDINSPRRLSTILQRKIGPGCSDTLPGCADYTSVPTETSPALPSSGFHVILLVGYCSPGWSGYTGTSMERTMRYPPSAFSSLPA
jgi:hypothetical protein